MQPVRMPYLGIIDDALIQWWYWTGHLTEKNPRADEAPRRFGFELVFFLVAPRELCRGGHGAELYAELGKAAVRQVYDTLREAGDPKGILSLFELGAELDDVLMAALKAGRLADGLPDVSLSGHLALNMAHLALTDIDAQTFYKDVMIWPGNYTPGERNRVDLSTPWSGRKVTATGEMGPNPDGSDGQSVRLSGQHRDFSIELTVNDPRPADIHYGGERHAYDFGGDTWYYSRTSMKVDSGTVTVGGRDYAVEGDIWFDRQAGGLVRAVRNGWQWFAIQLDDDVQIMLFFFNEASGASERIASVTVGGTSTQLSASEFEVTWGPETWKSPASRVKYPQAWTVNITPTKPIPGFTPRTLKIASQVDDQEIVVFPELLRYWEGACTVSDDAGSTIGKAYAELLPKPGCHRFQQD